MKKGLFYFFLMLIITSCNKHDFMNNIDFQKFLLAGSANYHNNSHTWYLDSLTINGNALDLTTKQKAFNITFKYDGTYTNSDGLYGNWDMIDLNHLNISTYNYSGTNSISKYTMLDINSVRFSYSNILNNVSYNYYYKIINQ